MSHQQILINGNNPTSGLQTLQHYLVNNQIANNDQQPHTANVHVQIVKQEQAQQRYIINRHQYSQQIQNNQTLLQPEIQIYWLLVEIESNNDVNSYALVESKDVIGQPLLDSLNTGKLVIVLINGKQKRATVVMASSDKNFIYAEYSQLNKMAEENLNLKLREGQVRNVKRRRISKDVDESSLVSGWSGVSQNENSDRMMSPSTQLKKTDHQNYVPPMTFDQGTQTDKRMTNESCGLQDQLQELHKLIELSEHILNEQKLLKNEAKMSRLLVESFSDEFSSMRKSINCIENKVETLFQERGQFEPVENLSTISGSKKKILNGSGTAPFFIIEHQEASSSSNLSLIEEWAEIEGQVVIGTNSTTVPVHILRSIDWKNYKTATRKLLITLFSRETLATRSLTGRPSPAFHDRNKPVKGKLDQNIINDIIQIVTRKCNVQESQVRTAITTKCADENKMLRNRKDNEEKEKFKTPQTSKILTENKENVVEN